MKTKSKAVLIIVIIMVAFLDFTAFSQDESNTEILMGKAIQKYLEGNIGQSITYLDNILTVEPDNERARKLMEKAAYRMAKMTKTSKDFERGLGYLKIAQKHIINTEAVDKNISEIRVMMLGSEKKEVVIEEQKDSSEKSPETVEKKITPEKQPYLKKPDDKKVEEYTKKISRLNAYIRKIERRAAESSGAKKAMLAEIKELKKDRENLFNKIAEAATKEKSVKFPVGSTVILIISGAIGVAFIYIVFKRQNLKLLKNVIRERQSVEDLKSSYNKDTEKLAQKLTQYGKSYQRAEELEKNWGKVISILERLTRDGSSNKLVIKESPDGRKAVTGIDPRLRARADSVEVIEEIFKDSPRASEMLRPFLDDKDNRTRANAAKAYYHYDPEKAIVVLRDMASDEDKWMRLSAAWALGEIKDTATGKVLEQLLDDSDIQVKNKARLSLEKILGKNARENGSEEKEE